MVYVESKNKNEKTSLFKSWSRRRFFPIERWKLWCRNIIDDVKPKGFVTPRVLHNGRTLNHNAELHHIWK